MAAESAREMGYVGSCKGDEGEGNGKSKVVGTGTMKSEKA
jgi:hypothetical protein